MADKFAVSQYQTNPPAAQQDHADFEHGDALGGVGIAAAVIE